MPEELEKRIQELEKVIQDMRVSATIPYDIGEAMADLLGGEELQKDGTGKSLTSEQHGAGAAGLKNPEVWLEVTIDGTRYYVPAYT